MGLINTFAFESAVSRQLTKIGGGTKIGDTSGDSFRMSKADCKIEWNKWSEWSACDQDADGVGYEYRNRIGKIVELPMGGGKPCPQGEEYSYDYQNRIVRQREKRECTRSEESEESEEIEEVDDVTEQGEQDGDADNTEENVVEDEEIDNSQGGSIQVSGQVSPQCPDNSTYDEDEKMCRCDLGYSLDESTGQCNRNTLGFLLDAKWWILSAAGAGGAYLYHRSR